MEREINLLKGEVEKSNVIINDDKEKFSDKLLDGLGGEMEEYLKNPPKENVRLKRKIEKKRKSSEFKRKFRKLVLGEKETED